MNSRGDPIPQVTALAQLTAAMPPQVTALAMLSEILQLLKGADQILPAAVKDLRAAETAAKDAYAGLEKLAAEGREEQARSSPVMGRTSQTDPSRTFRPSWRRWLTFRSRGLLAAAAHLSGL